MSEFLSFTVIGLTFASIYAITASGLVVTYTTTGVFNFASGAVGMVAAFTYYELWQVWNWPVLLALVVVLFVEAPLLAVVVEVLLMRRLHGASTTRALMVTLGLLLLLIGVATALWDPETLRQVPPFFPLHFVRILGVNVSYQQVITFFVAIAIAVVLRWFFRTFRLGVAMRAVVDDPELLSLAGAKPYRVSQAGWALGFALAALAGVLIAPTVSTSGLDITTLTLLVVNGYAAAVVGRLRSLPWTFAGALLLGLSTAYAQGYLPNYLPASLANLDTLIPEIIPVVFLFIVLLVLPATRLAPAGRLPTVAPPRVSGLTGSVGGGLVVVALAAVCAPLLSGVALSTVTLGVTLGIVGLSLVLLTGYAGQISLCQLTFLGVGAYTMGKVAGGGSWWGLLAAVAVCAGLGALVALPALRLRDLYLALATLAFAEAATYAFFNNSNYFPNGGEVTVNRLALPGLKTMGDRGWFVLVAVFFAVCAVVVLAIRRSAFGRRLVALSDSPAAFATLGMNPATAKVIVFAVSAGMAGLAGVLYGGTQNGISSTDVEFLLSLTLLLFVTIWGLRTVTGALLGGLTASILPVAETHLPRALSGLTFLAAGLGIFLIGRTPDGIVGAVLPWARRHLPLGSGAGADTPAGGPEVELAERGAGVAG